MYWVDFPWYQASVCHSCSQLAEKWGEGFTLFLCIFTSRNLYFLVLSRDTFLKFIKVFVWHVACKFNIVLVPVCHDLGVLLHHYYYLFVVCFTVHVDDFCQPGRTFTGFQSDFLCLCRTLYLGKGPTSPVTWAWLSSTARTAAAGERASWVLCSAASPCVKSSIIQMWSARWRRKVCLNPTTNSSLWMMLRFLTFAHCFPAIPDSDIIDRQRSRAKNSEGGEVPQKYFVVTNNQLLRVKYLLVYSQGKHLSR